MLARFGGPAVVRSVVREGERRAQLAPAPPFGCGAQPCPERVAFGLFPGIGESAGAAGERRAGQMRVSKQLLKRERRTLQRA